MCVCVFSQKSLANKPNNLQHNACMEDSRCPSVSIRLDAQWFGHEWAYVYVYRVVFAHARRWGGFSCLTSNELAHRLTS